MTIEQIWVDADACPKVIKEILFRAANRKSLPTTLVANQLIPVPKSPFIKAIQVPSGFDVADNFIVQRANIGDLVITADIPLAARVVEKGAQALDPRGKVYDKNNIGQVLSMRNFMDELRGRGVETGGPSGFGQKEKFNFANALDKFIAQR